MLNTLTAAAGTVPGRRYLSMSMLAAPFFWFQVVDATAVYHQLCAQVEYRNVCPEGTPLPVPAPAPAIDWDAAIERLIDELCNSQQSWAWNGTDCVPIHWMDHP